MVNETIATLSTAVVATFNKPTTHAVDTALLDGLTVAQVRSGTTKTHADLANVQNYPPPSQQDSVAGTSNARYSTPASAFEYYRAHYPPLDGAVLTRGAGGLVATPIINPTLLVDSDADLTLLQGTTESFAKVFNTWQRISHGGNGLYPSYPAELNKWEYSEAENQVYCTDNSLSLVGFISPQAYGDFTFEVRVGVNGQPGDDELIGICFGFVEEGGREHILTAMRTPCGRLYHTDYGGDTIHIPKLFDVWYNLFADDEMDLGSTNGGLKWADGVVDDSRNPFSEMGVGGAGLVWRSFPNGCLIKAVRVGDVITLTTTDLESTTYVPSATVVVDLNSHPALAKFKGTIKIGYVAYSQPRASWVALKRPGARATIVDVRTYTTHQWDGTTWVSSAGEAYKQFLEIGRFYHNPVTQRSFYLTYDKDLIAF